MNSSHIFFSSSSSWMPSVVWEKSFNCKLRFEWTWRKCFLHFLLFRQKQNKFNVAPCFPGKCIGQLNVDLTRRNQFIFKWRKRFCCRFQCHTYVLINKIAQWSWSFWTFFCIRHIKEMLIDSYFKIFVSFNLIFQIVNDFLDLIKSYYVKDVFSIHLIKQKNFCHFLLQIKILMRKKIFIRGRFFYSFNFYNF